MQNRDIIHRHSGQILYSGRFKSFRGCLEAAVRDKINLSGADLAHKNLCHANLDDAVLDGADFSGSNLIGANLSEAALDSADFTECSLESACLAFSSLRNCNFTNTRFGGTYIAGALIDEARFSGLSCLYLDFIDTGSMADCLYSDEGNRTAVFSAPPLLMHGLPKAIAIIGNQIKIGTRLYTPCSLQKLKDPLLYHYRDLLDAMVATRKNAVMRHAQAA